MLASIVTEATTFEMELRVGTNRPRHIHMNTPKIRILQKIFFATTKFEFESAN